MNPFPYRQEAPDFDRDHRLHTKLAPGDQLTPVSMEPRSIMAIQQLRAGNATPLSHANVTSSWYPIKLVGRAKLRPDGSSFIISPGRHSLSAHGRSSGAQMLPFDRQPVTF